MQLNQKEQIRRMYKILFILKKKNKKQEKHNHIQRIPEDSFHLKYWFSNENSNTYLWNVKCSENILVPCSQNYSERRNSLIFIIL